MQGPCHHTRAVGLGTPDSRAEREQLILGRIQRVEAALIAVDQRAQPAILSRPLARAGAPPCARTARLLGYR
jgi:hypothetical protein